jgi:hypothetical protein
MPLRPLRSKFDYGFDMKHILQDGNRLRTPQINPVANSGVKASQLIIKDDTKLDEEKYLVTRGITLKIEYPLFRGGKHYQSSEPVRQKGFAIL